MRGPTIARWTVLLAVLLAGCGAPAPSVAPSPSSSPARLTISVLRDDWNQALHVYTWPEAWPILQDLDLSDPMFTIELEDIELFDWSEQLVRLTPAATRRIQGWFPMGENCFVVTVDGTKAYGGIFFFRESAMAIQFPVIYSRMEHDRIIIDISSGGWLGPFSHEPPADRSRVQLDSIRAALEAAGKLTP
jgi:hypothetical protein